MCGHFNFYQICIDISTFYNLSVESNVTTTSNTFISKITLKKIIFFIYLNRVEISWREDRATLCLKVLPFFQSGGQEVKEELSGWWTVCFCDCLYTVFNGMLILWFEKNSIVCLNSKKSIWLEKDFCLISVPRNAGEHFNKTAIQFW